MAFYQAAFENDGLWFRLGTEKCPQELLFCVGSDCGWGYKRVAHIQYGSVAGKDGSLVQFSSYTFFRPKKLVKLIAARTGMSIREIES